MQLTLFSVDVVTSSVELNNSDTVVLLYRIDTLVEIFMYCCTCCVENRGRTARDS